jgi:oligopeptide transport system ATP-binding protein
MRGGRIVEAAPTESLLAAPGHPYTKLLIASVPGPDWEPSRSGALRAELEADEALAAPS